MNYIQGLSEQTASIIKKHLNCEIAFKTIQTVGNLFSKCKDKTPITKTHDIVYGIPCNNCKNWYIGNTSQLFEKRMNQHKTSVRNIEPKKSALAFHSIENEHRFDFDNSKILFKENNTFKRYLIEEIFIKNTNNCVNVRSVESKNVNNAYITFFNNFDHTIPQVECE